MRGMVPHILSASPSRLDPEVLHCCACLTSGELEANYSGKLEANYTVDGATWQETELLLSGSTEQNCINKSTMVACQYQRLNSMPLG